MTTTLGDILLELDHEKAPATVDNFISYVESGHYQGTIFHRVIKNFMIQGGGFDPSMHQKQTAAAIRNEANNGLSNEIGSIAMARTPNPHSASAQFFINTEDNTFLDFKSETPDGWGYCVFGRVVEGMDTVEKIEEVTTCNRGGHQDVPEEVIEITAAVLVD